jgi:hypothetical protein
VSDKPNTLSRCLVCPVVDECIALTIYHSSRLSIGRVKRVFCFSVVRDNQVKGISMAGTLHGQVRRNPSEKRSFVELPKIESRIIAHSVFISYCITPVNLWRRRVDE